MACWLTWLGFAALVAVATYFFGVLSIGLGLLIDGFTCIRTGLAATDGRRTALLAVGSLSILLPILVLVDVLTGGIVVTVR